jgi:phage tail sheath gpL-like
MADIGFSKIPANIRVPLFYAELNNSQANSAQQNGRALIIGQITSAGAAAPNVPFLSQGVSDAKKQGGPGSMLAQMVWAYRQNDPFGELWCLPLADAAGGATAAAGSVAFAGPAGAAGVLSLYVAGQLVAVPVTSGMTAAQLATAVAAAITAASDLPVNAAVDGMTTSKVDVTAKNVGLAGNDIDLRLNFLGSAGGEVTPVGLTVTIVAMTGGTINPTLTTALANLNSETFDYIVSPYTDAASVAAMTAFMNDTTGRWSWQTQVYGHVFVAYRGTAGALTTFGTALNDPHLSVMGVYDSPSPMWNWSAAMTGAAAVSLRDDPGLPLQTLQILGVKAPPLQSRFSLSIRNTLLYDGISTFSVDPTGVVSIENMITTYQLNTFGQPDNSYLEVETLFLLMYGLRQLQSMVTTKYARKKLAADGTRLVPGANVVTPSTIKADLIAQYREICDDGYYQNPDAFAAALLVQKNTQNPNRVDVSWPGTVINQLREFALLNMFRTQ